MHSIVITDLHLRDPAGSREAAAHAGRVAELIDKAAELVPDAELLILMGDLTDAGEDGAYDWLAERLAALPMPAVPMMGNHDDRPALRRVFAGTHPGGFIQSVHNSGNWRLVFLDTHKPGTEAGYLCDQRLGWLDARLDEGGEVCLFLHHPPCDIGDPTLDPLRLTNADELAAVIERHGNVRQIHFGHVHRTLFLCWHGIPCASLASLGAVGPKVAGGFAPAFGVLTTDEMGARFLVRPLT